jgi:adenylate cyclase
MLLVFSYINFNHLNKNFDEQLRTILFEIRGEIPVSSNVTIVDIDEKSIAELGQWPFPRIHMAQALANLTNAEAGVIGLDIVYSEYDRSSPSFMADKLNIKGKYQDYDNILASVISNTPTVIGYFFNDNNSKNNTPLVKTVFNTNNDKNILQFSNVVTNIDVITKNANSSGFFNAFSELSRQIIKMPLIAQYKNKIYPSLSLEMVSLASNTSKINLLYDEEMLYALELNNMTIPVDENGFMRINFAGSQHSFKYISFLDILNGNFNIEDIKNKFILIGTSVITLADLRSTVYDLAMPGVEIHANVIDNILRGDFLHSSSYNMIIDISIIFIFTVLMGSIFTYFSSLFIVLSVIFILLGTSYSLFYILFNYGIVLNLLYPLLSILSTMFISLYLNNMKERKQKEFIKDKFSKKVSLEVVNDLLLNNTDSFKAKEKEITIFFSDIRGFTNISEQINSPQRLIDLLNIYLEPMTTIIANNKGTIDKFIGDAVMAYWNAPAELKNHSDLSVKSAIEQIDALEKLNKTLQSEFEVFLKIGIGIHTGLAVIGEMGSKGRSDYTIIGDNVNLASRIEGLTKYFGAKILISQDTKDLLKERYNFKYVASVVVKGKTKSIALYEVLNRSDYKTYKLIKNDYEKAIYNYKKRNFKLSLELFYKIDKIQKHILNDVYIDKIIKIEESQDIDISLDFHMDSK